MIRFIVAILLVSAALGAATALTKPMPQRPQCPYNEHLVSTTENKETLTCTYLAAPYGRALTRTTHRKG